MEAKPDENAANNNPLPLCDLLDGISAVCAVGGAVAAAVTQSAAFAAFPLAGAVCVHLFNRRRLMEEMTQQTETLIRQQNLHIVNHQSSIKTLSEQLEQLQQTYQEQLKQQNQTNEGRFEKQDEEVTRLQQVIVELNQFTENLENQHQQVADIVGELRQIENFSQTLRTNPNAAEMYYQRGLSHQRLGDKQGAIADFTQAIEHNSYSPKAHHARGILNADLGNRKAAVQDLREASKLYFETGDIESYQKARDLSREFYNLGLAPAQEEAETQEETNNLPAQVLVGSLFDCN